jgi:hypothetical protein
VFEAAVRCRSLVALRCRGPLHFYSGRGLDDDDPRLIVIAPRLAASEARARLGNLERVHRLLANDRIPAVIDAAVDDDMPWVALACDAIADGDHIGDYIRETGDRPKHHVGTGLIAWLMETFAAIHRITDPKNGAPVCLGAMARGNVMFAPSGRIWLVGCGGGALDEACVAPEVACGGTPTPGADVYAVMMFMRGQMGLTEMLPIAQRIFAGQPLPEDAAAAQRVMAAVSILSMPPTQRPAMSEALAHAMETWRMFGFAPDTAAFSAFVARALAAEPERLADHPVRDTASIRVGLDGEWIETPNGIRHSLRARRPLRRVLHALAYARRDRSGCALTVDELLQAGWPGETPLAEAGSNRVYVAISTLRQLGLAELIQRWDGGYRLDPHVPLVVDQA